MTDQFEYWDRRERQERDSADRASDSTAKRIHIEMAKRYSALKSDETLRTTIPARG